MQITIAMSRLFELLEDLKITKVDKHWTMLCPFHEEETPSFVVGEEKYHCLSCGEEGDVADLLFHLAPDPREADEH